MRWMTQRARRKEWHWWFAWYPVTLTDTDYRVWLEWVERREGWSPGYGSDSFEWFYRQEDI